MNLPADPFHPGRGTGRAGRQLVMLAVLAAAAACPAETAGPAAGSGENRALTEGILKLAEDEWKLWELTAQRPTRLWEDSFFIMLSKTAALEPIPEEQFAWLDGPSYKTLLSDPARYVRLPVRAITMKVRVARVSKLLAGPGRGMPQSDHWPKDSPIWRIDCLNAETHRPDMQPLIVYATSDPTPLLPAADEEGENKDGSKYIGFKGNKPSYAELPLLQLAGIFYKVHRTTNRHGVESDFPVVLAWQLKQAGTGDTGSTIPYIAIIVLMILVGAVALFYLVRRLIQQTGPAGAHARYKPMRPEAQTGYRSGAAAAEEEDEIDPELKAAVDQYRKEKRPEHGKDDNG